MFGFFKYPHHHLPPHILYYNVILTLFQLKGGIYAPRLELRWSCQCFKNVMLGDYQGWAIKHDAFSILFARTLEPVARVIVRNVTTLRPPCCKEVQTRLGRLDIGTLVDSQMVSQATTSISQTYE